jgi:hypothetical protein
MYWADGDRYEGNWENDCKKGHGVFYFANGERYEGNWEDDSREGYGVEYNEDGTVKRKG